MLFSLPRRTDEVLLSLIFPHRTGLPYLSARSASTSSFSRPHRVFTCVTACIIAGSPIRDPFHRRLRRLRCLYRRFDCYWASDPSQAGLAPAETHKHSRRTLRMLSVWGQNGVCRVSRRIRAAVRTRPFSRQKLGRRTVLRRKWRSENRRTPGRVGLASLRRSAS
jgi:hypothetical protein